jgi:hypothetical protein
LIPDPPVLLSGNRYDAPDGEYWSLYGATQPYGCMLEKLAGFRDIDPNFDGRLLAETDEDEPDEEFDVAPLRGVVPAD